TDARAEEGALAVAVAASYAAARAPGRIDRAECLALIRGEVRGEELVSALAAVEKCLARGDAAEALADELGLARGVSGYVNHTVPVCLFSWLRHPADFRAAVEEVILLGGDADTTGAIVGGLSGATVGEEGIPQEWLQGLIEWPRSVGWMRRLAARLAAGFPHDGVLEEEGLPGPLPLFWPGIIPRNVLFTTVVLLHGLRRLLPPY
ncbi:MAG: ADP-ribosylglycohydrolase family protein, partial [Planctomycetota bacterium]